ncbi:MAG: DNA (cytosine-5-)-methyltransferase [Candidatus Paraimprobicoccus trichonymphae]|uniref:Cytosine-specific methyltransferase n=1 Tax=Candidatus Paraimprobicoccus trichonymphae TaxID=3033793 RepID=A0AA48I4W6_9FIRM|nr:MAG: DNA (cytosine-5-)-methyltransferase [Candidatus Paraimprobicoccus trichonymphae]
MNKEYIWNLADLRSIAKNGLKVFSCFSCGGGSCMGYKLAGFEVIGNNEIDKKINTMYVKNHKPKYNLNCDIREMLNINLPDELYDLDILDGSPPCSTFSMAGSREKAWGVKKKFLEGQKLQRLDDLFFHFINFAERIKPKMVVAENVKGLILGKSKGYVNEIIKAFQKIGYQVQIFLLNSKYMGVPQARERVFFIARRKDLNLSDLKLIFNENPIKYGEFSDTNFKPIKSTSRAYELWKQRNKTDNDLSKANVRTGNKKSNFGMKLIHIDKVCPTITSSGCFLRFDVAGTLSDKDFITAQTFPQDYDFCGRSVQYVCGMSVPPIMMKK